MNGKNVFFLLSAAWEFLRFGIVFFVIFSGVQDTKFSFTFLLLWFGSSQLMLPVGFLAFGLFPTKYAAVRPLLVFGKLINCILGIVLIAIDAVPLFFSQSVAGSRPVFTFFMIVLVIVFDLIFFSFLLSWKEKQKTDQNSKQLPGFDVTRVEEE